MTKMRPVRVPIGIASRRWATIRPERTVLAVVHNITTLTRMLDVLGLFDSDLRVQVVATTSGTDPFVHGLREAVTELGIVEIPWEQATLTEFDLIISASHHGGLMELHGPLAILSHGVGYTKYSPGAGSREPGAGSREPGAGSREPGAGSVFGLSAEWLLYDGRPIADALVLSHHEQLGRLTAAVPQVVHTASVSGDPCYDRMRVSVSRRPSFRARLGAYVGQTVIVVSSTWSPSSLLGSRPHLLRELLAELPVDSYRVLLVAHPNIWHGHGPWQLRMWLADCVRAGLVIVPELEGWRAALIAADCVIGDNGAVTCYAAALGRPVLLAAFPDHEVATGSPVELLGRLAPRLIPGRSARSQIDSAIADYAPERYAPVGALVSSVPGESPRLLRELFYRLLVLPEPPSEPLLHPIPFDGLPAAVPKPRVSAYVVSAEVDPLASSVALTRYPAEVQPSGAAPSDVAATHLAVHAYHPDRRLRANADVLFVLADELGHDPDAWQGSTLRDHPGAAIAAVVDARRCLIWDRDGAHIELVAPDDGIDPCLFASAAFAWQAAGHPAEDLTSGVRLTAGGSAIDIAVRTG